MVREQQIVSELAVTQLLAGANPVLHPNPTDLAEPGSSLRNCLIEVQLLQWGLMKEAFRLKELGILPGRFKIVGETKNHIIIECGGRFVIDKIYAVHLDHLRSACTKNMPS